MRDVCPGVKIWHGMFCPGMFCPTFLSGSPEKSQSYQASIQCWAIVDPPAKRHLNGVKQLFKVNFVVDYVMTKMGATIKQGDSNIA